MENGTMRSGTIVGLRLDKGFGFIFEKAGQPDIYFHVSNLCDGLEFDEALRERRVRFDVVDTPKGPRACNIRSAE